MKNRLLFILSGAGVLLGAVSAVIYTRQPKPLPPVFNPASDPYGNGIYANGIVESYQDDGENINLYPEVSGPVTRIWVKEGAAVHKGDPLVSIDDSVQKATAEQQRAQADAAEATLRELQAQPRPEVLQVAAAQLDNAKAVLKTAQDQLDKVEASYAIEPRSVSRDALDNARNAVTVAATNAQVAQRQYELTRAGAWSYDIITQAKQAQSLDRSAAAAEALLGKFVLKAPADGVVLSIGGPVGGYVSPQGVYDTYTEATGPLVVMGGSPRYLQVRCYVDEILVQRLPPPDRIKAQMTIHGTDTHIPLTFVRIQPYVSPKIELSDERAERVDVRVLPVIFRFQPDANSHVYPGQMVDVYLGQD